VCSGHCCHELSSQGGCLTVKPTNDAADETDGAQNTKMVHEAGCEFLQHDDSNSFALARQQGRWLVSAGLTGSLLSAEVQLVRFTNLYNSCIGTYQWFSRKTDLAVAATAAGLLEVGDGWAIKAHERPPASVYGHMTISDEVQRQGQLLASAWAWEILSDLPAAWPLRSLEIRDPYSAIDAYIWHRAPALTWAYWCCRMKDGDDAASLSVRSIATWVALSNVPRQTSVLPDVVHELQSHWAWAQRNLRIERKFLTFAAAAAGLPLISEPEPD
jgi:hypothetical protein